MMVKSIASQKYCILQYFRRSLSYHLSLRPLYISLTRIKHNCSSLNADVNRVNIVPSALCSCGTANETAQHYFFDCNLFIVPIETVY